MNDIRPLLVLFITYCVVTIVGLIGKMTQQPNEVIEVQTTDMNNDFETDSIFFQNEDFCE